MIITAEKKMLITIELDPKQIEDLASGREIYQSAHTPAWGNKTDENVMVHIYNSGVVFKPKEDI